MGYLVGAKGQGLTVKGCASCPDREECWVGIG